MFPKSLDRQIKQIYRENKNKHTIFSYIGIIEPFNGQKWDKLCDLNGGQKYKITNFELNDAIDVLKVFRQVDIVDIWGK